MTKNSDKPVEKILVENRKARHEYHFLDHWEAGISLMGSEVKSCRQGQINLVDSYGMVKSGEIYLLNVNIAPYTMANRFNHDPRRTRKLLLHRNEIDRITGKLNAGGLTLIPTRFYIKNGRIKVTITLAKGKKLYDKRRELKKKAVERELRASGLR